MSRTELEELGGEAFVGTQQLRAHAHGFFMDARLYGSRRPAVLRCLHAIDATRFRQTRSWVVSFSILRPFGPFPVNTMLRAGRRRRRRRRAVRPGDARPRFAGLRALGAHEGQEQLAAGPPHRARGRGAAHGVFDAVATFFEPPLPD